MRSRPASAGANNKTRAFWRDVVLRSEDINTQQGILAPLQFFPNRHDILQELSVFLSNVAESS